MPFHLLWLGVLFSLAVVVGAIVFVVVLATRPHTPYAPTQPAAMTRETPLEILSRRFAAGEISADEYEKARDLLSQPGATPRP